MKTLINIADLKDTSDSKGRTFREINNATIHKFQIDDLVELDRGIRLFVHSLNRDCDGTPLYTLSSCKTSSYLNPDLIYGCSEDSMVKITQTIEV